MAYIQDTYYLGDYIATEIKFIGRNGAKGERRAKKIKATPEQMARQNQWTREKKEKYLILANFRTGDVWVTLKYPRGTRPDADRIKRDWKVITTEMRKLYKKLGIPFKWVNRMEIGRFGGPHIHFLCNRVDNIDTLIKDTWHKTIADLIVPGKNYVNIAPYDSDGAKEVAEYLTAKPDKKGIEEQLNLFGEEEQKVFCKVSSSRNLVRPEPKRKKYAHWTMARFFKDGIKPDKGYYVMPNTVKVGVNKCTGYSYLYYMQRTISDGKSPGNRIKPQWEADYTHYEKS